MHDVSSIYGIDFAHTKGYIYLKPKKISLNYGIRKMNIVNFRIGHLLLHLIVFLTLEFHSNWKPIVAELLKLNPEEINSCFYEHFKTD